jgi:hypothetical protein
MSVYELLTRLRELLGSTKKGFLDQLNYYHLLNENSTPCDQFPGALQNSVWMLETFSGFNRLTNKLDTGYQNAK